ncbi:type II/IV secretion system ATPase subunit [Nitrosopumilus piranensis]|uniref:Putative type IV pilus assembly ATPase of Type II secretion system protein family n=1 Tax=Nitrosopumilus piranensis TaxID=1582439 RepID=A0A0C5BY06_9ARCH|nr:type II/IV secretion system ATPase subunit [Nitrosopumilus piranensis]AJM93201.1 putative type IV pilus assembly ATPase of Type II secretion system protein family [Nitrosopumilus piranensis]
MESSLNQSDTDKTKSKINLSKEDALNTTKRLNKNYLDLSKLDYSDFDIYSGILKDASSESGIKYEVIEPTMSKKNIASYNELKKILMAELVIDLNELKSKQGAEKLLKQQIISIVKKYKLKIPASVLPKILYYAVRDLIYLGKIEPFLHDHMIEEISCDGSKIPIYVWHREHESIPSNVIFEDEKELEDFTRKLAYVSGKNISVAQPIVDASLPDGSRVNLTFGREITKKGSTFTIRKFRSDPITIIDLIKFNTLSSDIAAYLWYFVEKKLTMIVAGGTASGKTTTLNTLASFITPGQKIISIEDTQELNLTHTNWVPSVSRETFSGTQIAEISQFDLLRASLRQRPDIIIVGETRGKEAYTLFQAMATGHGGFSSIHADSIPSTVTRLVSEPMNVPKTLIVNTLDAILLQLKMKVHGKTVRRVIQVSELAGLDEKTGEVLLNDVFRWNPSTDQHSFTGRSVALEKIENEFGESQEDIKYELNKRKTTLDWMVKNNIVRYNEVSSNIIEFYKDPDKFYERKRILL